MGVCEACGYETHAIYQVNLGAFQQQMLRCVECACCQIEAPFPEDAVTTFYKSQYFSQYTFDQLKSRLLAKDYWAKCRPYIDALGGPFARVLEIGAGYGFFSALLARKLHANVSVVEISQNCVAYIEKHYPEIRVHPVPINETSKGELGEFDFVFSGHCIEHLQSFQEYFEALATLLKPGGIGIILTPNALSATFARYKTTWEWCHPEQHFQFLSTRTPVEFFRKYGLEPVEMTSVVPAPIHCPGDWLPAWVSRLLRMETPLLRQQSRNAIPLSVVSGQSAFWNKGKQMFNNMLPYSGRKIMTGWLAGAVSRMYGPTVRDELMIVVRRT